MDDRWGAGPRMLVRFHLDSSYSAPYRLFGMCLVEDYEYMGDSSWNNRFGGVHGVGALKGSVTG